MAEQNAGDNQGGAPQWLKDHRTAYLRSGGTEGHILAIGSEGGFQFLTNCLIKYKGRKSGKTYIVPVTYSVMDGEIVICGSRAGGPKDPAWYRNIHGTKEVEVQIGTQAFRASLREPEGEEREKVWAFLQQAYPLYTTYQANTERRLPVVMLKAIEPIPVFKESDATGTWKW